MPKGVKISKILSSIKAIFTLLAAAKATMVAISNFWYRFLTFLTHFFLTKLVKTQHFDQKNKLTLPNETHEHVHEMCATWHWTTFMP